MGIEKEAKDIVKGVGLGCKGRKKQEKDVLKGSGLG